LIYNDFADIYDKLMSGVDYDLWRDYIIDIFKKYEKTPEIILDLGCGTGNVTLALADRGFSMIGLDISARMLDIASGKARERGADVLFINQDMRSFELYGTVDAVICTLDGINYLKNVNDLQKVFSLVKLYLNDGGIFIFDINTEHKIKNVVAPNNFVFDSEEIFYTWQNELRGDKCDYILDFFVREGGDKYARFSEIHTQKIFTNSDIKTAAGKSGLTLIDSFDEFTFDAPKPDSERVFYVFIKL